MTSQPHSSPELAPAIVELAQKLLMLKALPRTGWLQRGVPKAESIAEHSFGVASLALLIAAHDQTLDQARLLAIAVLHDQAEALLGDLPASASRLLGAELKHQAEARAMQELCGSLPQGSELVRLWEEYAAGASREARLIKALDRVEMLIQALQYQQAGRRNLDEFWVGATKNLSEFPLVEQIVQVLLQQRAELRGSAS
jgi:putative hydrolase of HD superfamily